MIKKSFERSNDLIIDLGMNNGDDTDYYLKKGYRVVAVEANPILCEQANKRFHNALKKEKLIILNVGIWTGYDRKTFFINLNNNHWSSLDKIWAERDNSSCMPIEIDTISINHLFDKFGIPLYLKIDIEGADGLVLSQLEKCNHLPFYLSLEDCRFGYEYMKSLVTLGYQTFQILDQSQVPKMQDNKIGHYFPLGSSGPFGEYLQSEWLDYQAMLEKYSQEVRDYQNNRLAPRTHWWDIHCRGALASDI
jgi:FkbM family methyltransferase